MDATPLNLARPEVPVELAALVAKMMAKEPERRFQEPKEVAQALTPFFKSGSVGVVGPKPEVSQVSRTVASSKNPGSGFRSSQPVANTLPTPLPASRRAQSPQGGPIWESLIDLRQNVPTSSELKSSPAELGRSRTSWIWLAVTAGMLLIALVVAGVIIRIKTKDRDIVLRNPPDQSEIITDDQRIVVKPSGGGDSIEIIPLPGGQGAKVKQGASEEAGKDVTLQSGSGKGMNVRVEPRTDPQSDKGEIEVSRAPIEEKEIRPFNGRNFEGWHALTRDRVIDPSRVFRVEGDEIVWAGNPGRIFPNNAFRNFSFKFAYLLPLNGRYGTTYCRLKLAEGDPYQIGEVDYRVGEVGCALTNGREGKTSDVVICPYDLANGARSVAQRTGDTARPANEWNDVEIRCEGREISFFLNGHLVNRVEGNREIICHPGLQSWDTDIHFRNIRIVPLAKSNTIAKKDIKDVFQPGSIWKGEQIRTVEGNSRSFPISFVVREREGDKFKARLEVGPNVREVNGSIRDGRISWLAKDVRLIEGGHQGHDHTGTIRGEEILLEYAGIGVPEGKPVSGTVKLQIEK